MKLRFDGEEFAKALRPFVACATLAPKEHAEAGKLTLQVEQNRVVAYVDGGTVVASGPLPVISVEGNEEKLTVSAKGLSSVVGSFSGSDGPLEMTLTGETAQTRQLIVRGSGGEALQTISVEMRAIPLPKFVSASTPRFTMRRLEFLNAARVTPALGFEDRRPKFMRWVVRYRPGGYRAAAGSGSRFLIYEKEGAGVIDACTPGEVFIHRQHTKALLDILTRSDEENIILYETIDQQMSYVSVQAGSLLIQLSGHTLDFQWPEVSVLTDRIGPYRATVRLADCRAAMKGIAATRNTEDEQDDPVHGMSMCMDLSERVLRLEAGSSHRSVRIIPLLDAHGETSVTDEVRIVSMFFNEMVKHGHGDGNVQIDVVNGRSPLVVRFYAGTVVEEQVWRRDVMAGTRERFTMLIASRKSE